MNILFLGDSITDCDHCFTRDNLGYGYVKYLSEALPAHTMINGGTDGFTFPRIYQKWKNMYRETACDTAVILAGVNDAAVLMEAGPDSVQAAAFLDTSRAALYSLLQGLAAGGTRKIILINPFLFEEFGWTASWASGLERIKNMIHNVFAEFSLQKSNTEFPQGESKCELLSFFEYLNRRNGHPFDAYRNQSPTQAVSESQLLHAPLSSDGVHPNDTGHRLLAEMLLEHLLL